jgi:Family of unknown function (DUF6286)
MRLLLRVLAPLFGLALAACGVLLVIEVVVAWVRTPATVGVVVPWPEWQEALRETTWATPPVLGIAVGVAAVGLVLVLVGLLARRSDVRLVAPGEAMTVTTAPRVLARLVGTRVRADDDVAAASVTVSARRVAVTATAWDDPGGLRDSVVERVGQLLDELPLARRPRVAVSVVERGEAR